MYAFKVKCLGIYCIRFVTAYTRCIVWHRAVFFRIIHGSFAHVVILFMRAGTMTIINITSCEYTVFI